MTTPDVNVRTGNINSLTNLMAKFLATEYAKVYYVDNVNGLSTYNGLSWTKPFAQPSEAITAWEAYRAAQTNIYAKGLIKIRGTGTAYDALTALPSYCDMEGVGANPRGDGTGIVVIKGTGADAAAGSARGLGLYNIQFTCSGAGYYAMDV